MDKKLVLPAVVALIGLWAAAEPREWNQQPGSDKVDTTTNKELVLMPVGEGVTSAKTDKNSDNKTSKDGLNAIYNKNGNVNLNDGQLNPRAVAFVQDYLDDNKERLEKMKTWGVGYFNLIDKILTRNNLPKELKYLAVIESELQSNCLSRVGARGPWQFMPETGRLMGLQVNSHRDDRTNLYKSTEAAAKYLRSLYAELNDWLLVIAAYNGGTSRVMSAIRKSKSRDFWQLQYYLPAESRNHVKKFIATHYIMEGRGGVTTVGLDQALLMSSAKLDEATLSATDTINLSGKYNSQVIAKALAIDMTEFNRLNPGFDKVVASNGYDLRLPKEKVAEFNSSKDEILNESVQMLLNDVSGKSDKANYPEEVKLPARKSNSIRLKNK
jgi:membrane-bound lytic murein transglycosylase D